MRFKIKKKTCLQYYHLDATLFLFSKNHFVSEQLPYHSYNWHTLSTDRDLLHKKNGPI